MSLFHNIRKRNVFQFAVKICRLAITVFKYPLALFFSREEISEKHAPHYQQMDVWRKEYLAWESHKDYLLGKAQPRDCPLCHSKQNAHLWNSEDGYEYVRCLECDFVFVTPFITYDQWRDYYRKFQTDTDGINSELSESRAAEDYLKDDFERFSYYVNLLRKYKRSGNVLDIGCLTGNFLKIAKDNGFSPFGVEFRPVAIETAKSLYGIQNIWNGYFEEIAPQLIAADTRYDIISLWETLEHVLYPEEVIRNARRLLAPGGLIAITVPNFDNLQVKILREKCFHCLGGIGNAGHINMFTPLTLRHFLEKNGFEMLHLETEGSSNYYDIVNYFSQDYDSIHSYSQAVINRRLDSQKNTSHFISPLTSNFILAFNPFLKILKNVMRKGAIITAVAQRTE